MTNLTLFDLPAAEAAKDAGLNAAAASRLELLAEARRIAVEIAMSRADRKCTADDVRMEMAKRGITESLGNAAGSLFKGAQWRFSGEWRKSVVVTSHAHQNRVWELVR